MGFNKSAKFKYKKLSSEYDNIILESETIKFKFEIDTTNNDIGWIFNRIVMSINDLEIGDLVFTILPLQLWEEYYGTIIKWMYKKNKLFLQNTKFESLEFKKIIINEFCVETNKKCNDNMIDYYEDAIKYFENKYKEVYNQEKKYLVDKPKIYFSRIYDFKDMIKNNYKELRNEKRERYIRIIDDIFHGRKDIEDIDIIPPKYLKCYRNKGYSKYLYIKAMEWVNLNEQCLYAGVLNEHSERVWKSFKYNNKFYHEVIHPFDSSKHRKLITKEKALIK